MRTSCCTCVTLFLLSLRKWPSMSSNRKSPWSRSSTSTTKQTMFMNKSSSVWPWKRQFQMKSTCLTTLRLLSLSLCKLCRSSVPCANVSASPCTKFIITLCITEHVKLVTYFSRRRWPLWLFNPSRLSIIRFCTTELWFKLVWAHSALVKLRKRATCLLIFARTTSIKNWSVKSWLRMTRRLLSKKLKRKSAKFHSISRSTCLSWSAYTSFAACWWKCPILQPINSLLTSRPNSVLSAAWLKSTIPMLSKALLKLTATDLFSQPALSTNLTGALLSAMWRQSLLSHALPICQPQLSLKFWVMSSSAPLSTLSCSELLASTNLSSFPCWVNCLKWMWKLWKQAAHLIMQNKLQMSFDVPNDLLVVSSIGTDIKEI